MPRVNNLPKSANIIRNIGIPKIAYTIVMALPVFVLGEMCPYPKTRNGKT